MPEPDAGSRIVRDISSDLWTLERDPEARFISTELFSGLPAIRVPSNSAINFGLNVPPGAQLITGVVVEGQGDLSASVQINGEVISARDLGAVAEPDAEDISWLKVGLSPWSGEAAAISLTTASDQRDLAGLWIMPQIESTSPWILPDPIPSTYDIQPGGYRFEEIAELAGYMINPSRLKAGETAVIDLLWRPLQRTDAYATVFTHLIDSDGNLVAQHDSQPVDNAYPLPAWREGVIVRDSHQITIPPELPAGTYSLYIGLYDPDTLQRWSVIRPDGLASIDHAVLLDTPIEVMP